MKTIEDAIKDICRNKHGKAVLCAVNKKRDYKEVAKVAGCSKSQSSSLLNQANIFKLIVKDKESGKWKKTPEFRHTNINQVLRNSTIVVPAEKKIKVKKVRKKTNIEQVKKDIILFFQSHYRDIPLAPVITGLEKSVV